MRALIVDDNASMRAMLAALLGSQGYEVMELEDGSRVMEVIRKNPPSVVCLDYQMPGRDGLEILREINEAAPEVDVLFMTASDDLTIEQKAADAGASGFLRKPFGQSQVIEELQEVMATREQASMLHVAPGEGLVMPRTVVVADDSAAIRFMLKGLLGSIGLNVVRAVANGREAISAVRELKPQILCLDVEMPVMSGMDALPEIRQASPSTAVVMISGSATREFVSKAGQLGARGFIVKPVRPAYIEEFMKKLLG